MNIFSYLDNNQVTDWHFLFYIIFKTIIESTSELLALALGDIKNI